MFNYLHKGEYHTDTSAAYMKLLGMSKDTIESVLAQVEYESQALGVSVRARRDKMIRDTDFYLLPDSPSVPAGLEGYRQALRDVPQQAGFPWHIEWPAL